MVDQIQEISRKQDWVTIAPNASKAELTEDMVFNDGHIISIVTYSILMVVSAIGNITVLVIILRRRRNTRSRINTMLMHLAIADLLVTFLMMPLEIGWNATVSWKAGDLMCRVMSFFRIFGLYLSSFVIVCISIDRYYAVLKPLNLSDIDRRGKLMLTAAWAASTVCSMPQMIIFHVENHPNITWYEQCVTYHVLDDLSDLIYKFFGMIMMYALPLFVIIYSYSCISCEIYRKYRDCQNDVNQFRRSSSGFLGRAKIKTLKMTIIIVFVFILCWTPYNVMSLWYWLDKDSARKVDQRIQKALFFFASTNSCMNPIVYGVFNIRTRGQNRNHSVSQASRHLSHQRVDLHQKMNHNLQLNSVQTETRMFWAVFWKKKKKKKRSGLSSQRPGCREDIKISWLPVTDGKLDVPTPVRDVSDFHVL